MTGPLRWLKRTATATMFLTAITGTAHAQYLFSYAVFGSYTPGTDGYPFTNLLCSGTTSVINYDNNPLTTNPKMSEWCPELGTGNPSFGAQFSTTLYAPADGIFDFYVGSDDGSGLYIDGAKVMGLAGERPFHSDVVSIPMLANTTHTYLLNYYANSYGGSAVQATVDSRVNVGTDLTALVTPEPSLALLVATGLGLLGLGQHLRRRKRAVA